MPTAVNPAAVAALVERRNQTLNNFLDSPNADRELLRLLGELSDAIAFYSPEYTASGTPALAPGAATDANVTAVGNTLLTQLQAIAANTASDKFEYVLMADVISETNSVTFYHRIDKTAGTVTPLSLALTPYTVVGTPRIVNALTTGKTAVSTTFEAKTTSAGNWTIDQPLRRVENWILGASSNTLVSSAWINDATGLPLSVIPIIGTDVDEEQDLLLDAVQLVRDRLTDRTQKTQISNGTIEVAVKTSAPVVADPALVVALSPNGNAIDTELPAAATLADAIANPATPTVGAANLGFNGTTWDRLRSGQTGVLTTATGLANTIGVGQFNTTLPTLTNGNLAPFQLDASARQIIAPLTNASIVKAQLQDNAGTAITLGTKTIATSLGVNIASDQVPNIITQNWKVQITDGTNTLPTGDAIARSIFTRIGDGTNSAVFKAASTAAVAADSSLVTAFSPNSPLPTGTNVVGRFAIDQTTPGTTNFVTSNQTQIGGVTIATGLGASSTGTQRVAIAQDSRLIPWDGTTNIAIKPASTAAVAADPALVVAINPQTLLNTGLPAAAALADAIANPTTPTVGAANLGFNGTTWDRLRSGQTGVLTTATGLANTIGVGQFNTTLPTLANGNLAPFQLDVSARQIIAPLTNASIVKAQLQDNAGTAINLGTKTIATSLGVNLASDQVPNILAQNWKVQVTDGTNTLPTGDTIARSIFTRIGDGVTNAFIAPASTAPIAANPAVVVSLSPNGNVVDTELPAAAALADAIVNPTTPTVGAANLGFNGTTWDRLRSGLVAVQTAFAGILNTLPLARFNLTPPTLADGNVAPLQVDVNGNLRTTTTTTPIPITDIASSAITATTTSIAVTPSGGISYRVEIPVTAVTGTSPTLDGEIQELFDLTNWRTVYRFDRIIAPGNYRSPLIPLSGTQIRYVQTIGGTTPSFTRSIVRYQSQQPANYAPISRPANAFNPLNAGISLAAFGRTRRMTATNRTAGLLYIHIHDSILPPANGTIPIEVLQLPATTTLPFTVADFGEFGTVLGAAVNPRVSISTTFNTYTQPSAIAANQLHLFIESL